MLKKLFTPLTVIICFGVVTVFQFAVAAQGSAPDPTPIPPYQELKETVSFLSVIGTFLMFVVGVVWWVWKGRDTQLLRDQAAGWKDEVDRLRGDRDDARTELELEREEHRKQVGTLNGQIVVLRSDIEELRKLNLRLQGWIGTEEKK